MQFLTSIHTHKKDICYFNALSYILVHLKLTTLLSKQRRYYPNGYNSGTEICQGYTASK